MSPGSTVRPEASITSVPARQPAPGVPVVTASIRPLSIWITASRTAGAPVPSIRVPARIIFMALLPRAALGGLFARQVLDARDGLGARSGDQDLDDVGSREVGEVDQLLALRGDRQVAHGDVPFPLE